MDDIRAELKAMLKEFSAVRIREDSNMIVASCPGENTFEVALKEQSGDITVYFDACAEYFEIGPGCVCEEVDREALRWFFTGLSDTCRLQVFRHRDIDYKWVIEIANPQGGWSQVRTITKLPEGLAFWRKRSRRCLQNAAVTRADIDRLFPAT